MQDVIVLAETVAGNVWATFAHNWPFLLSAVLAAAALNVYVGTDRISGWLRRRTVVAVVGAVVLATLTPFCSCGTTAVVLGALATTAPWAPVVAFMVSSPLTSPAQLALSGGLFGWPFAWTFFIGAVVLGLGAGWITAVVSRTGWLEGQSRLPATSRQPANGDIGAVACCAGSSSATAPPASTRADSACCTVPSVVTVGTSTIPLVEQSAPAAVRWPEQVQTRTVGTAGPYLVNPRAAGPRHGVQLSPASGAWLAKSKVPEFAREVRDLGVRLALFFFGFAALGYTLIELIPTGWLTDYLGGDSLLAVPLAALLGIPVYFSSDASLPLVGALVDGGMGQGPAMAFLVTGAGTSVGAIGGMLLIARRRVVALVLAILFAGALLLGWFATLVLPG